MDAQARRDVVFVVLSGVFVANAILGEVTEGKLFTLGPFQCEYRVIPWPVVFLTTDLVNEYFGRGGVKKLTLMTVATTNYSYKFLIAVGLTPLLYMGHSIIDKFLAVEEAHRLIEHSAKAS